MKKLLLLSLSAMVLGFSACSDDEDTNPDPTGPTLYMNIKPNSTWNYRQTDSTSAGTTTNNFVMTSTSQDTSINSRAYHVFNRSDMGNIYHSIITNNTYYTYQPFPFDIGTVQYFDNLFLKSEANVNESWSQVYTIPVPVNGTDVEMPVTLTHRIAEKGLTKTVNGISYNNVIHVASSIAIPNVPGFSLTSDLHFYYAPNAGLIYSSTYLTLSQPGSTNTIKNVVELMSSDLK